MVVRKIFELEDVIVADGEEFHAVGVHLVADVRDGRADGIEFAGLDFDGDLPEGDEGEDEFVLVGAQDLFCFGGAAVVCDDVPEEGVGVDQHPHLEVFFRTGFGPRLSNFGSSASKSFWISRSVSGEKASGAIQILPMPEPRRCLRDLRTGGVTMTSLTAGLPARAMITSSPLSTAAMSLDRLVFA